MEYQIQVQATNRNPNLINPILPIFSHFQHHMCICKGLMF